MRNNQEPKTFALRAKWAINRQRRRISELYLIVDQYEKLVKGQQEEIERLTNQRNSAYEELEKLRENLNAQRYELSEVE